MPKFYRPTPRLAAVSIVAHYFRAFIGFLRIRQNGRARREDRLSDVEIDGDAELIRQHAIDHAVEAVQAMYGQDFGLRSLAQEVSHKEKRLLTEFTKEDVITSLVTEVPAAPSDIAQRHFADMLTFETDCWDVQESLKSSEPDFVLVDVRGPASFRKGHVAGAINIPHGKVTAIHMAKYTKEKVFVVYCAGPHCNDANKAAVRLARLGFPVKMMIGGITGWLDEGFALTAVGETVR